MRIHTLDHQMELRQLKHCISNLVSYYMKSIQYDTDCFVMLRQMKWASKTTIENIWYKSPLRI